jgi:putative oxidoreductase
VLGLFTPLAGVVLAVAMAVAAFVVHLFVEPGGCELVGVLAAAALMLSVAGPGRISLDALRGGRTSGRRRAVGRRARATARAPQSVGAGS